MIEDINVPEVTLNQEIGRSNPPQVIDSDDQRASSTTTKQSIKLLMNKRGSNSGSALKNNANAP